MDRTKRISRPGFDLFSPGLCKRREPEPALLTCRAQPARTQTPQHKRRFAAQHCHRLRPGRKKVDRTKRSSRPGFDLFSPGLRKCREPGRALLTCRGQPAAAQRQQRERRQFDSVAPASEARRGASEKWHCCSRAAPFFVGRFRGVERTRAQCQADGAERHLNLRGTTASVIRAQV